MVHRDVHFGNLGKITIWWSILLGGNVKYGKMTPVKELLKQRIIRILAADDRYATYKAVADYLGVHWRALMSAKRDPRNDLNARIVHRSSLYYRPSPIPSKVWLPGPAFNSYIDARLKQAGT